VALEEGQGRVNEQVFLGDGPVVGFGNPALAVPAATPWAEIIVTSVVSAAAGWALDEAATRFSSKKRKRRR